ncbi:MAG: hypothetical protein KZQ73_09340, partial [Candidatus Thiodiazotropha sp. (ex Semelilucina semeliformis)]|nr:hypothetical protein [Candidatus Thiodiazotropha sp. (ex Semelilucina semeliformis)]
MSEAARIQFTGNDVASLVIQHDVTVDAASGSAITHVPIPLRPGRSGFGPQLGLSYTSAPTNSAYGVGWSLTGTSFISISTHQKLPYYDDRDSYVINGAEALVPVLLDNAGQWEPKVAKQGDYWIYYYRTQTEKHFRRIERWLHETTQRVFWLVRESNGVVSVYGYQADNHSRLYDSQHPERIFMWLLEAQYDGNGNAIYYDYQAENADNINSAESFEYQRILKGQSYNQRYLKRIRYGNTRALSPDYSIAELPMPGDNRWLFEVVFDYGDHDTINLPAPASSHAWPVRPDPHSTFRPGFEVRTYRLCRRILLFHHFDELDNAPVLVSAMGLEHQLQHAGSTLERITYTAYRNDNGTHTQQSLPALNLNYTQCSVAAHFKPAQQTTLDNLPAGLSGSNHRWVDLYGEGLSGVLTETRRAWYYKSNLGDGQFSVQQTVVEKPTQRLGQYAISDFNRDGNLNLVILQGRGAGYCEYDRNSESWSSYRPFPQTPNFEGQGRQQWL